MRRTVFPVSSFGRGRLDGQIPRLMVPGTASMAVPFSGSRLAVALSDSGARHSAASSLATVRAAVCSAHRPLVTAPSTMIAAPQPAGRSQPA